MNMKDQTSNELAADEVPRPQNTLPANWAEFCLKATNLSSADEVTRAPAVMNNCFAEPVSEYETGEQDLKIKELQGFSTH